MEDTYFLIVKLIQEQNCFVKVSRKLLLNQPICPVRVIIGGQVNRPHYFTAVENNDRNSDSIHFPQVLGQQLGLQSGSLVPVRFIKERAPNCHRCSISLVEPKGLSIDTYHYEMTNNILDQIRVVYSGLVFPFWTVTKDVLFFKVNFISPDVEFVMLIQDSLVEIGYDSNQSGQNTFSVTDKLKGFFSFFNNSSPKDPADGETQPGCDAVDSVISYNELMFKQISRPRLKSIFNVLKPPSGMDTLSELNTAWVNGDQLGLAVGNEGILILMKLLAPSEKAKKSDSKTNSDPITKRSDSIDPKEEDIFLSSYILVKPCPDCPPSCVYLSDNLRKQMDLTFHSKVIFRSHSTNTTETATPPFIKLAVKNLPVYFTPISVQTNVSSEAIRRDLKTYIAKYKTLILCRGSCIDVSDQDFIISCDPKEQVIAINSNIIDGLDIRLKQTTFSRVSTSWGKRLPLMKLPEISGPEVPTNSLTVYLPYPFIPWMEKELASANKFLEHILNLDLPSSPAITETTSFARNVLLIQGPKGSGKTCFLFHVIAQTKQKFPSLFTQTIHCGSWKSISFLKKTWISSIAEAVHSQPSVLIFEGLDLVAPHISRVEEVPGVDTIASIRASYIFSSIIKSFDELNVKLGSRIAIIATCYSQVSLNPHLVPTRGRTVFSQTISLDNPNFNQRKQIIQSFLDHHIGSVKSYPWLDQVSYRCEGYLISDLLNLVDSAIHHKVTLNQSGNIEEENFRDALQKFRPSMLTDIRIEKTSEITFKDVGGLGEVKNLLRSTLLLPLKYPVLFGKCPIRPPRNILLYGAPGTGKSFIAEALANESKVNLIKIRGPELLSKYIGKSEESIRELFERAAIAKPCIIFFDEFESLAPKRGQDTTGVTDRVVNQLLAQMDGVEVIEQGVYAIAATSRPDLLDPALLRPGRFDKYICCDFPAPEERLDIWKVLGKDLTFDDSFDHSIIPSITEHFTGADIRALLINSQYAAIEDHEKNLSSSVLEPTADQQEIKMNEKHVLAARSKTKPCIDSVKRSEYRTIYDKFSGIEAATLPAHQRATLA